MKKPEALKAAAEGSMPDKAFAGLYPTLSEYLTHDRYDDGSARDLSAISIKVQEGAILVILQDHDLSRSLFVVGPSLGEALKSLEKHASNPGADWRSWKSPQKKRK